LEVLRVERQEHAGAGLVGCRSDERVAGASACDTAAAGGGYEELPVGAGSMATSLPCRMKLSSSDASTVEGALRPASSMMAFTTAILHACDSPGRAERKRPRR